MGALQVYIRPTPAINTRWVLDMLTDGSRVK
jgi:hypothetical protein